MGLGHRFLRHVERTSILLHLIDASGDDRQPYEDYQVLARELAAYKREPLDRTHVIVLNKIDLIDEERLAEVQQYLPRSICRWSRFRRKKVMVWKQEGKTRRSSGTTAARGGAS